MELHELRLQHFRQFYGEQRFTFSNDPVKNVTVIHGDNGAGKTALLNAFKWVLYGTTDFDSKKNLVNERAVVETAAGESLTIFGEVVFTHEGARYTARREMSYTKSEGLQVEEEGSRFDLSYVGDDGRFETSPNPENHMQQILPENLHPYFFFNGENIEKLAQSGGAEKIRGAIKNLMGLQIVERAVEHLGTLVIKDLRKELKKAPSVELQEIVDEQNELEDSLETYRRNKEQLTANRRQLEEELEAVENTLVKNRESAALQTERSNLEAEVDNLRAQQKETLRSRADTVGRNGFLPFTTRMCEKARAVLQEKDTRGELPSKIKRQFVEDLVARGMCICGRPLTDGEEACAEVKSFLDSAPPVEMENAFYAAKAAVGALGQARETFFDKLHEQTVRLKQLDRRIKKCNGRIDEICGTMGDTPVEEVRKLELKRGELKEKSRNCTLEIGRLDNQIAQIEKKLVEVRKRLDQYSELDHKAQEVKRQLHYATECRAVLEELYDALANDVKNNLSSRVNDTFRAILRKDYWAEIDDDYALQIHKKVGEHSQLVYDKSTGENQVTSLSFIGSIINISRERYESADSEYFRGGIYPIVMDSPFGNLDPEYRALVAQTIPKLASQVVLMASDSQWQGEVESEVKNKAGKEYTLVYYDPDPKPERLSDTCRKSECGYEYTEVKEGHYGS